MPHDRANGKLTGGAFAPSILGKLMQALFLPSTLSLYMQGVQPNRNQKNTGHMPGISCYCCPYVLGNFNAYWLAPTSVGRMRWCARFGMAVLASARAACGAWPVVSPAIPVARVRTCRCYNVVNCVPHGLALALRGLASGRYGGLGYLYLNQPGWATYHRRWQCVLLRWCLGHCQRCGKPPCFFGVA